MARVRRLLRRFRMNSMRTASPNTESAPPWPPQPWVPDYTVESIRVDESAPGVRSEEVRLVFPDWMGRAVSLYARRSYPLRDANGAAVLHIVGGAQTILPGDLSVWTDEGYAAAGFDWQISGVGGRPPERMSRFPREVVAQFSATPTLAAAMLPVAVQAAAVCLHWLARCPAVDGERLGVTGISWGGYLAWLLAAYDSRVRALVPVFGCGGLFAEGRPVATHAPEVRAYWERNWEPAALGHLIQAPVCYLNGTNDFFGDLLVAEPLLDSLRVPVARSYLPNVDHSLSAGQTELAKAWMRQHLLGGVELPMPLDPQASDSNGASDMFWWADAEGPSMHRCWLPGMPPRDRSAFVFSNRTLPGGAVVSSPVRRLEANTERTPPVMPETAPRNIPFGLGWRWELGGARHFSNDARAAAPASPDQSWVVVPARPKNNEAVVVLLHLAPQWMRGLSTASSLNLGWSVAPEGDVVAVEIHARASFQGTYEVFFPWREGAIVINLEDVPELLEDFAWPNVGRLQISARQERQPFEVGPLRVGY